MPKILLVEDNEMNRDMLSRRLQRKGYQVVLAVDGRSGVEMTQTQAPDLVLMDVIMPGIKGRDLCKKIKAYEVLKDISVIFLTAKDSEDDIQAELEAGAVTHLTKPVNPTDLLQVINGIIGK